MARKRKKKRKISDNSVSNDSVCKAGRFSASPEGVCLSKILNETNNILYDDNDIDPFRLSQMMSL